jgi:hypothetical protein
MSGVSMRSWIFRNRLRLRALYAPRPAITLQRALPRKGSGTPREGLIPGQCGWRGAVFVLRPQIAGA